MDGGLRACVGGSFAARAKYTGFLMVYLLGYFYVYDTIRQRWAGSPDDTTIYYTGAIYHFSHDHYLMQWVHDQLVILAFEQARRLRAFAPINDLNDEHLMFGQQEMRYLHKKVKLDEAVASSSCAATGTAPTATAATATAAADTAATGTAVTTVEEDTAATTAGEAAAATITTPKKAGTPDDTTIHYTGVSLFSRDRYLMQWFHDQLETFDITSTLAEAQVRGHHFHIFCVKYRGEERKKCTLKTHAAYQDNIFQYHGICYNQEAPNRTACVIGQDLFDLNLFDLNITCEFIGFPPYQDTYEFSLEEFMAAFRAITTGDPLNTPGRRLGAECLYICEQRVITDGVIINKACKPPFYFCGINDCPKWYLQHALIPFECPVEGCNQQFDFPSGLMAHKRHEHGSEPAILCSLSKSN
ncbi:hypothetical protein MBANPS3_003569 [Mucor bainieri]